MDNNFKVPFLPGLKRKREDDGGSASKRQTIEACGDIFPSKLTLKFENFLILSHLILNQRVIGTIVKHMIPFLSFVSFRDYLKLYYKKLDMNQTLTDHLSYMLNSSSSAEGSSARQTTLSKEKLIKRLDKPISLANKKNADVRVGYRWHSIFFVKYMFTFGIRKTEADEIHLLQSDGPLLFYRKKNNKEPANLKSIDFLNNDRHYDRYTLTPGSIYVVKANVYYAIVALQKCKIALNRCRKDFVNILDEKNISWYDPRDPDRVTRAYVHPPPTPSLDRDAEWEPPDSDEDEEQPNNNNNNTNDEEVPMLYYINLNSDFDRQQSAEGQNVVDETTAAMQFEIPEQQQSVSETELDMSTTQQEEVEAQQQQRQPMHDNRSSSTTRMQPEREEISPRQSNDGGSLPTTRMQQPEVSTPPQSFDNVIETIRMQHHHHQQQDSSIWTAPMQQQPEVSTPPESFDSSIWTAPMQPTQQQHHHQPQDSSIWTAPMQQQPEVSTQPESFDSSIWTAPMQQPEMEEQSVSDALDILTVLVTDLEQERQSPEEVTVVRQSVIRYAPPAAGTSCESKMRFADGDDLDLYLLQFFQ